MMISKSKYFGISFLCLFTLFAFLGTTHSHANTDQQACVDPDGDGWGWNGTSSCKIECVDTDGDGWGWNGTSSCKVTSACIDSDGDGWGWDGYRSCRVECIDSDGDGWGWDGFNSCRVADDDNLENAREQFKKDLVGFRVSECFNLDPDSYRILDAYTDKYNVEDYHYYQGNTNCEGSPLGLSFPLQVYTYRIGDRVTTEDGRVAWEIDWTSIQQGGDQFSFFGDDFGVEEGVTSYSIINVEDGLVLYGEGEATGEPIARETRLELESPDQIAKPFGDDSLSAEVLAASVWRSNCVYRSPGSSASDTRTFTSSSETFVRTVWNSEDCSGDIDFQYQLDIDLEFNDTLSKTVFGGYILNHREEITTATILQGEPDEDQLATINNFAGRVKYQGYGLIGDTLFSGHCLLLENCETSPDNYSDILDIGFTYRWTR